MTEEESLAGAGGDAQNEAGDGTKPVKKKTSVKVVRRVKSKKSEKGERPELAPPPSPSQPTIDELQDNDTSGQVENNKSTPPTNTTTTTASKQQVESTTTGSSVTPRSGAPERRVSSKRRAQRSGSNVFAMFTQNQVAQFKEAFGFIDQDKDGIISKSDIRATFDALGRLCSDKELEEMASEAPGPINFTMFLSVFGDRIQGTDEENVVVDAFNRFDEGDGFCREDKLRHVLTTWGTKFSQQECDVILQEAPVDSRGRIDLKRFANLVTRGAAEEEEVAA